MISNSNRGESVVPQFCDKWDILTFGLHTSGRYRGRTKRSYSSIGPNTPDTWSADMIKIKMMTTKQYTVWQSSLFVATFTIHFFCYIRWNLRIFGLV